MKSQTNIKTRGDIHIPMLFQPKCPWDARLVGSFINLAIFSYDKRRVWALTTYIGLCTRVWRFKFCIIFAFLFPFAFLSLCLAVACSKYLVLHVVRTYVCTLCTVCTVCTVCTLCTVCTVQYVLYVQYVQYVQYLQYEQYVQYVFST